MEKQRHLLSDLWESYPEAISNEFISQKKYSIMEHLTDILAIGPFYHYVINVGDYSLTQVSENAIHIHGFETRPTNLKEIIDQIHPDDLDFVLEAEEFTLRKMAEIGFEHQLNLKSSYCFRMRIADSTYRLFHHQAIHLNKDNQGRLLTALNIHTDIQHLTKVNNKIVLVSGIGTRKDYVQIDLSNKNQNVEIPSFSKREMDIITLIVKGNSSLQIAEQLFISPNTVRTHRKNLFKKTKVKSVGEFVRKCIEWGLLQLIFLC
ncbi:MULTISPECIES: helix-turn-helix domain-containing protein [Sphingobacterium]|uniref:helix-turn-helix domain-containing protein n=1 Tax=Sphingobacterium TaxID=28453 RepID=UPI0010533F2A|nr:MULTISPECIES: helix-turn-helix transcriptional regulator [Sphingobacterium]MCW2262081.1 DNA-binding CsgD family transcriptional regulator [Sphingobacterium kitahiroshimense]TCR13172.1 regulatory LuxR family protein [Sphingobacterium sp. JUb78]